jgi:hypothetical protein
MEPERFIVSDEGKQVIDTETNEVVAKSLTMENTMIRIVCDEFNWRVRNQPSFVWGVLSVTRLYRIFEFTDYGWQLYQSL